VKPALAKAEIDDIRAHLPGAGDLIQEPLPREAAGQKRFGKPESAGALKRRRGSEANFSRGLSTEADEFIHAEAAIASGTTGKAEPRGDVNNRPAKSGCPGRAPEELAKTGRPACGGSFIFQAGFFAGKAI
jgi:hypothetical protein